MALHNIVKVNVATTGTGSVTPGSAVDSFLDFTDGGVADAEEVDYCIYEGANREVGSGVYDADTNTLTRVVETSTNANAAIDLAGAAILMITPRAGNLVTSINGAAGDITLTASDVDASAATTVNHTPAGDSVNDYLDSIDSAIGQGVAESTTIASASTVDIGGATTLRISITGTTTITSFGTVANMLRIVTFTGALTLTHNGTSLILPDSANMITAAGDSAIMSSDGSGNWRCVAYQRAAPRQLVESSIPVGSSVAMTTGTPITITSIAVPAGDWLIWANFMLDTVAGTTTTIAEASISTVNNTHATAPGAGAYIFWRGSLTGVSIPFAQAVGQIRVRLTTTTTYYLVGRATFTGSTCAGFGYLGAIRQR